MIAAVEVAVGGIGGIDHWLLAFEGTEQQQHFSWQWER